MTIDHHVLKGYCGILKMMVIMELQEREVPWNKWLCVHDEKLPLVQKILSGLRNYWMLKPLNQTGGHTLDSRNYTEMS